MAVPIVAAALGAGDGVAPSPDHCGRPALRAGKCSRRVADGDPGTLASLVEKSLLVRHDGRLTMLETIREFALERLAHEHEELDMRRRHAEYFVEVGWEAKPGLKTAEVGTWLKRLEAEHDNLRAALEWSLEHEPDAFVRLTDALFLF